MWPYSLVIFSICPRIHRIARAGIYPPGKTYHYYYHHHYHFYHYYILLLLYCYILLLLLLRIQVYLCSLVETWQPADLGGPLLGASGASQGQEGPLGDHQHVPHAELDVLLSLLLVVVKCSVLKALRTHPAVCVCLCVCICLCESSLSG